MAPGRYAAGVDAEVMASAAGMNPVTMPCTMRNTQSCSGVCTNTSSRLTTASDQMARTTMIRWP